VRWDSLYVRKLVDGSPLYVKISSIGEGVKRAILVYMAAELFNPLLLLWDDVEAAAHPSLVRSLIRWLASLDWQVVVTTHSLDVLYLVAVEQPSDAQVIILNRESDDTVDYCTLRGDP